MRTRGSGTTVFGSRLRAALLAIALAFFLCFPLFMVTFGDWDGWRKAMRRHMYGGSDTSGEPATAGGMAASVDIRDFAFRPGNLVVPVGATVTWTNADDAPHNARDGGGSWSTIRLERSDADTITFDAAGSYTYECEYHPDMVARLTVR